MIFAKHLKLCRLDRKNQAYNLSNFIPKNVKGARNYKASKIPPSQIQILGTPRRGDSAQVPLAEGYRRLA
ncbi:UNVERIFIED_CONTAM: hypothetical protein QYH65_17970, partial [Kocuria sp. CPCC 205300]